MLYHLSRHIHCYTDRPDSLARRVQDQVFKGAEGGCGHPPPNATNVSWSMNASAWKYRSDGMDYTSKAKPGPLSCETQKNQWLATEKREVTVVSGNGWVKEVRGKRSQKHRSEREYDDLDEVYDGSSVGSTVIVGEQLAAEGV